jgi:hypothetical protein
VRQNPDFVARQLSDGMVLVPISREVAELESVFRINAVGARIWELVGTGATEEQIASTLVCEYQVEPDEALADVKELLATLREIKAVVDE